MAPLTFTATSGGVNRPQRPCCLLILSTRGTPRDRIGRISFGPLQYELVAADDWGDATLDDVRRHVEMQTFEGASLRRVIYAGVETTQAERRMVDGGRLPAPLQAAHAGALPADGWRVTGDDAGSILWLHPGSPVTFLTPSPLPPPLRARIRLPWQAIVQDVVGYGGAVVHAALVTHADRAYLLTAPPGGGKTSTVARLPKGWTLLGDDGCLLWAGSGQFFASPLPTWSHVLGVGAAPVGVVTWRVADAVPVYGLVLLTKAARDSLAELDPLGATVAFYRAFSEHPAVVGARTELRAHLLETVGALADTVPCHEARLALAAAPLDDLFCALADAG